MSNEEMKRRLSQVLQALNNVTVSGKVNLSNLTGSIAILEDIFQSIPEEEQQEE